MDGELITAGDFIAELRRAGVEIRDDCDLCDRRRPAVTGFDVLPHRLASVSPILLTDFGACRECALLVDAGRWEEILQRWKPDSPERRLVEGYRDNLIIAPPSWRGP